MSDYKEINKAAWNLKSSIHVDSEFYDNKSFLKGESSLKDIELNLLGDVKGKSILHLQCHFGQDTISLSRLGANVTGVDFSDKAIHYAREMAEQLSASTTFLCSDVYELPAVLDKQFDIVFTSYGVIGWLPDLERWAKVVSQYMKPGGRFIMVEFHPVVWMFDESFQSIDYSYFNTGEIVENMEGSYADRNSAIEYSTITWNHGLSEVLGNLIKAGIRIASFDEYDYSPYSCFKNTLQIGKDKYRIKHLDGKLPMVFAVEGIKG